MGTWWIVFVCNLLLPVIMIISGWMMWKHCPKTINGLWGYRTSRSMKNMDTWKFAHAYCGRLWWILGWVVLLFSVLGQLPFIYASEKTLGVVTTVLCTVQCAVLLISIFPTERALKKTFTKDGVRRGI